MTSTVMPRDLPMIRERLVECWAPHGLFSQVIAAARPQHACDIGGYGFNADIYAAWERNTLDRAALVWVAEPMCELLQAAANSVPDDVVLDDLEFPSERGFVVLEQPYVGTSTDDGSPITVHAFLWGPVHLPPLRDSDGPGGVLGFAIASYEWLDPRPDLSVAAANVVDGRMWCMLGRSDWPQRDTIIQAPWAMPDHVVASFLEDRRILAALWTLLQQRGLALSIDERHARPVRRRLDRAGIPSSRQLVRVVTLRETHAGVAPLASQEARREHTHRWIVQGHWRNQPHGPGRTLRRLQWIAPYTKGPADGELITPHVVNAWRR